MKVQISEQKTNRQNYLISINNSHKSAAFGEEVESDIY